ncbi:MAG: GGDEF domain-containing protein [Campylobacterales bacterium]|nr:GGDEF domain-containing protein [Campylobacterales bacterium]
MITALTLEEKVYLERVRLFFQGAIRNLISSIVGGIFLGLILHSANVPDVYIAIWFCILVFAALLTAYVEKRVSAIELNMENVTKLVYIRAFSGVLIGFVYGVTPFIFQSYFGILQEMFLFIILSATVSIVIVGYSIMPYYYVLVNLVTMTPLTFYFLKYFDTVHIVLALTAFIWQYLLLSKAWRVSQSSINALRLNEKLQYEIHEHEVTKIKLQELAMHDMLTGVANRLLLMENLESMISLATRNKQNVVVMFLDLDGFKEVNDNYGHEAGDYLLQVVAKRLQTLIRRTDTLARMGGDEFILGFMQPAQTDVLAQRVISAINEPIELVDKKSVSVGVSIGIAHFPKDAKNAEELIRIADDRMYLSKAEGKNTFH